MLTTILFGLLWLAVGALVLWIIIWILGWIGFPVPDQIRKILFAILLLLVVIWCVSGGVYIPHFRR